MSKVLLGVTGSVAAIKTPELCAALRQAGHEVQVIATRAARYFFSSPSCAPCAVMGDEDEWPGDRYQRGDSVLHIELRRWADVLLIAPLDANTLAKLACGLCDNCLTCVWRAWEPARPVVLAPAMNTLMWEHPYTRQHLRQIALGFGESPPEGDADQLLTWINRSMDWLRIVPPISKQLACGDMGVGAMADLAAIVRACP